MKADPFYHLKPGSKTETQSSSRRGWHAAKTTHCVSCRVSSAVNCLDVRENASEHPRERLAWDGHGNASPCRWTPRSCDEATCVHLLRGGHRPLRREQHRGRAEHRCDGFGRDYVCKLCWTCRHLWAARKCIKVHHRLESFASQRGLSR